MISPTLLERVSPVVVSETLQHCRLLLGNRYDWNNPGAGPAKAKSMNFFSTVLARTRLTCFATVVEGLVRRTYGFFAP